MRRGYGTIFALALVLPAWALLFAACGSGPSDDALARNQPPPTTTTTTLPPEGIAVVTIRNGKFAPAILALNLEETWIVRWVNEDPPREYTLNFGDFQSPTLLPGDTYEVDFSELETGIYRYKAAIGSQLIPGTVDTRPQR